MLHKFSLTSSVLCTPYDTVCLMTSSSQPGWRRTVQGTKVLRYNWPFPMLKYKIIFSKYNIRKQFYQTALGNCYGLKLAKCWLQLKNKFIVLFIIISGTLSFPAVSRKRPFSCSCILLTKWRAGLFGLSVVSIFLVCSIFRFMLYAFCVFAVYMSCDMSCIS